MLQAIEMFLLDLLQRASQPLCPCRSGQRIVCGVLSKTKSRTSQESILPPIILVSSQKTFKLVLLKPDNATLFWHHQRSMEEPRMSVLPVEADNCQCLSCPSQTLRHYLDSDLELKRAYAYPHPEVQDLCVLARITR